MAITPTGARGEAVTKLESLLAASTTFKDRIRSGITDAEAKERIFYPWQLDDDCDATPFAVIEDESETDSRDSTATFRISGNLALRIYDRLRLPDESPSQRKDAYLELLNFFEGVLSDLRDNSIVNDALAIQQIQADQVMVESPLETPEEPNVRPLYILPVTVTWSPHGQAG